MQNEPASDARSGLLLDALRFRAGLVITCLLLGLAAGYGAHLLRSPTYTSTATVFVSPLEGNAYAPGCTDELTCLETESSIATSDAVLHRVQRKLKLATTIPAIRSRVDVAVPTNQLMLQITASSPSQEQARAMSQALAQSFLEFRTARAVFVKEARESSTSTAIADLRSTQADVLARLENASPTTADFLRAYARDLRSQLLTLNNQLLEVQGGTTFAGRISNYPLAASSGGLPLSVLLIAGGLLGLLIGLALAAGRERASDLIRNADDVELAGLPVLVSLATSTGKPGARLSADEAYRQIRTAVLTALPAPGSCVVAGVTPAAPAAEVGAYLALSLWRAGEKVAYVDVTAEGSASVPPLTSGGGAGLAEAARGDVDPAELLQSVDPGLWYLPPGGESAEAREYLVPSRLRPAIGGLTQVADYVVLGANTITTAAGQAAVASSPLTVFVVALHSAKRPELLEARRLIERSGTTTLGVVLTDRATKRGRARTPAPPR